MLASVLASPVILDCDNFSNLTIFSVASVEIARVSEN